MSEMEYEPEPLPITIPRLTLGWRLQMAMDQGGHSREYMALRCGVAPSTISRWLHDQGKRPPRKGDLQIFADEGRVPLEWLTQEGYPSGPTVVTGVGTEISTGQLDLRFLSVVPAFAGDLELSAPVPLSERLLRIAS